MSNFTCYVGEQIRKYRKAGKMTLQDLADAIHKSRATICKYENGRVNMPNSVIMRLVEIFQVSADYLLGTDEVVPLLKSSSAKLSSSSMPHTPAIGVPLVGFVHAGLPMLADENITEYIPVSANEVSSGECFFMQVEGDCMTGDHIVEGSLVLVRKCVEADNNCIGVVRIGDEVLLRHIQRFGKQLALTPSNPAYNTMIVSEGDVQIIGKVIETRLRF